MQIHDKQCNNVMLLSYTIIKHVFFFNLCKFLEII